MSSNGATPVRTQRTRSTTSRNTNTMLLHVNLPKDLVLAVRQLADEEGRTITSQVARLLEDSPELIAYLAPIKS